MREAVESTAGARGRVCFSVPYLYPVAAAGTELLVGGIEVQDWHLARGLAARGFEVAVATCDFGQPRVEKLEGVTLFATFARDAGLPGARLVYPRLWKTMRTLRHVDADVYLANGASLSTGWAYDAARSKRAAFVFLAASDKDLVRSLPALTKRRERWWFLRALRGADAHVAQTALQADLLRSNFGLEARIVANPVELPREVADAGANETVLWLSTYKESKRPEWFLAAARALPHVKFMMAGYAPSPNANRSWQAALGAAAELPNLDVRGFVEHSKIGALLSQAGVFAHTSPLEGFPNNLLEAWSYAIPSVAAVDPDGVIARFGLGVPATDASSFVEAIDRLMADSSRRRADGARARAYVEHHHAPERTTDALAALLDGVLASRRRRRQILPGPR